MADECVYIGQTAMYKGPFKEVKDDDGHTYPRGKPVEICTDTAEKLGRPPFKDFFIVTASNKKNGEPCCDDGEPC